MASVKMKQSFKVKAGFKHETYVHMSPKENEIHEGLVVNGKTNLTS